MDCTNAIFQPKSGRYTQALLGSKSILNFEHRLVAALARILLLVSVTPDRRKSNDFWKQD